MTVGARRNPEARRRRQLRQRQRVLPQVQALGEELVEKFPQAFFREPTQVQPLKKGIAKDIRVTFSSRSYVLHSALHFYMTRPAYLRALAEGRPRIDLSGQCVESVSPEEQQQAREQLKARKRHQRRRPLQQPAMPPHTLAESI